MRRVRAALRRLVNLFHRDRLERELADELDAHLELHTRDNIRAGMAPDEARRQSILALGGIEQTKERCRDRRSLPVLETFLQDVRFGARALRKNPAFTLGALSALTIGIGANVIIFSVANTLILRPLPVTDPEQLVRAYTAGYSNTPYPDYLDYRDRNHTLSGLAAFQGVSLVLRTDGPAEHVAGVAVSGNYFETLGLSAAQGRVIAREDDRPGAPGVLVLSDGYWRRRFGHDSALVGRLISVNGHPFTVIGIAPPTFTGTQSPVMVDAWVPWNAPTLAPTAAQLAAGGGRPAHLIGRLLPGVTLAQAQAALATVATSAASRSGSDRARTLTLYPARTLLPQMSSMVGTFLALLTAVAALVLLVACVNIAGLLIARAEGRRREIAVRLALGASRKRLIGQLLTESLLLSSLAAVTGSALAAVVGRIVARVSLPVSEPLALDLAFDWRVLAFTAGLSLLTTILFGLVPAAQSSKMDVLPGLRDGATATAGRRRAWMRGALVTAQITFSTLLLIGAGVLVRSMTNARAIDLGFSADRILTASVDLSTLSYPRERGIDFFERLRTRLDQDSRIVHASLVGTVPLTVSNQALGVVKEGAVSPESNQRVPPVFFDSVSPGYFRTVEIPLLAGRDFSQADHAGAPEVAIVNETLANRFWPGENPIGKRLRSLGARNALGPAIEVVGLARNAKYATVGEDAKMFMYLPLSQQYTSRVTLLVKTTGDPMAALPFLRTAIQDRDPEIAIFRVSTLDQATRVSLLPVQVAATLTAVLGLVALALAAIGIYAMTTCLVRQRTREVGIRLALGANPSEVVRALTREGLRWTTTGLVLGLTASLAATHLLRSLLYEISSMDPVAFIAIPALLSLTAYVACRAPAGAASRVDPLLALREE